VVTLLKVTLVSKRTVVYKQPDVNASVCCAFISSPHTYVYQKVSRDYFHRTPTSSST